MSLDREIQDVLLEAGDAATAFMWRRLCRDLDGPLRVAVSALDDGLLRRVVGLLQEVEVVALPQLNLQEEQSIGAIDRLLSSHMMIWATPYSSAFGKRERTLLHSLVELGAPADRALLLADRAVLQQVCDEPTREAAEVEERVVGLLSDDWRLIKEPEISEFLSLDPAQSRSLRAQRKRAVGRLLLEDASSRARHNLTHGWTQLNKVKELLSQEDSLLQKARADGEQVARHLLGAVSRHTTTLEHDFSDWVVELEASLSSEMEAVSDVVLLRRALPHWLRHLISLWMEQAIEGWRAAVMADVGDLEISEEDLDLMVLLVPALSPRPIRSHAHWAQQAVPAAAAGTAAALLVLGLWLPGLLAVTGGLALSAYNRVGREDDSREQLLQSAREAVQEFGREGRRVLEEQRQSLVLLLGELGNSREQAVSESRHTLREKLKTEYEALRLSIIAEQGHLSLLAEALGDTVQLRSAPEPLRATVPNQPPSPLKSGAAQEEAAAEMVADEAADLL